MLSITNTHQNILILNLLILESLILKKIDLKNQKKFLVQKDLMNFPSEIQKKIKQDYRANKISIDVGGAQTQQEILTNLESLDNKQVLEIFRSNKQKSITDAAIKTASIGGFDEKIKSYCGGKASGGRIGLEKGTDICPAATKDPEGFLKRLINDPQLSKFFKSAKAVAIAKNVARAG